MPAAVWELISITSNKGILKQKIIRENCMDLEFFNGNAYLIVIFIRSNTIKKAYLGYYRHLDHI